MIVEQNRVLCCVLRNFHMQLLAGQGGKFRVNLIYFYTNQTRCLWIMLMVMIKLQFPSTSLSKTLHHSILWVPIDQSIIISLKLILLELNEKMTTSSLINPAGLTMKEVSAKLYITTNQESRQRFIFSWIIKPWSYSRCFTKYYTCNKFLRFFYSMM